MAYRGLTTLPKTLNRNIYIVKYIKYSMNKKIIVRTRKINSAGQVGLTIPKWTGIEGGEYVEVKLLSQNNDNESLNN